MIELENKGNHPVVRQLTFQGMRIAIETDKGKERHWHDKDSGESGTTTMKFPYGFFMGTKKNGDAGDGMALDVYVGPEEETENVYVVHQMKKPDFKEFDELKVMVGFESEKQAKISYIMHYNDDRFFGKIEKLTVQEFKDKYLKDAVEKALGLSAGPLNPLQNPQGTGVLPTTLRPMPPQIDVETLEGVNNLLGRLGKLADKELLNLAEEIWGPGFSYTDTSIDHARCEMTGFLLDQKDLLECASQLNPSSVTQTSWPASQESTTGLPSTNVPSGDVRSSMDVSNSVNSAS